MEKITAEQLAEEYCNYHSTDVSYQVARFAFIAGYNKGREFHHEMLDVLRTINEEEWLGESPISNYIKSIITKIENNE